MVHSERLLYGGLECPLMYCFFPGYETVFYISSDNREVRRELKHVTHLYLLTCNNNFMFGQRMVSLKVGNDHEIARSEINFYSKTRGGT